MPRLALSVLLLVAHAAAQQHASTRLTAALERHRASCRAPGLTAAVCRSDGSVLAVATGVRDTARTDPLRADDRMFCGSVGKTWFAAVTLALVGDGRLSLDDPIAAHLGDEPWFAQLPNHDKITVRNLLRHDSGLPRWIEAPGALAEMAKPDRTWRDGEQLQHVFDRPPLHRAGDGWAYSDTNYIVLGLIVERIARRPIYELVAERLLAPHALTGTRPGNRREIEGLVQGHVRMFRRFGFAERTLRDGRLAFDPSSEWCGGGFVTDATDLARWARIQGRDERRIVDAVPAAPLGEGTRYGLGVMLRDTALGPTRGHDGVFPGYCATMLWFERHDLGVAVLANTDTVLPALLPAAVALARLAIADRNEGGPQRDR